MLPTSTLVKIMHSCSSVSEAIVHENENRRAIQIYMLERHGRWGAVCPSPRTFGVSEK